MEIDPVVPVLPTLTTGKSAGALRTKSGFEVTTTVNDALNGEDAPAVVAWIVTG